MAHGIAGVASWSPRLPTGAIGLESGQPQGCPRIGGLILGQPGASFRRPSGLGPAFPHGITGELDFVCVMDQAVEDGVGKGRLIDVGVPFRDGELARDNGGRLAVTVVDDLEEISLGLITERGEAEVVDDEELDLGEASEEAAFFLERFGFDEFVDETRQTEVSNREVLPARGLSERTGDVALAHAGRATDEDIESLLDPTEVHQARPQSAIEASCSALIDILDGGALWQLGPAQTLGEASTRPLRALVIEEEAKPLVKGHGSKVWALTLLVEGPGHATKTKIEKGLMQRLSQHATSSK